MRTRKPEPVKNPGRISSYWKAQWKVVIAITLSGLLFNGSMSIGPNLQGGLIDAIVPRQELRDKLGKLLAFMLPVAG